MRIEMASASVHAPAAGGGGVRGAERYSNHGVVSRDKQRESPAMASATPSHCCMRRDEPETHPIYDL